MNDTTEKSEPAMPRWRAMTQLTRAVEKLTAEEIHELAVMAHLMKEKNGG